jgi:hypothetical protein
MNQFQIALAIMVLVFIFDKKTLRVELDKVAKFLAFMAIITAIRLALMSHSNSFGNSNLMDIPFYSFGLVFWEDLFYAIPIYYTRHLKDHKYAKYVWYSLIIALSAHFGMGHLYQGVFAVFLTAIYPYFISYRYGKDVGFGTVMAGHVLYDMITFLTVKYGWMVNV